MLDFFLAKNGILVVVRIFTTVLYLNLHYISDSFGVKPVYIRVGEDRYITTDIQKYCNNNR